MEYVLLYLHKTMAIDTIANEQIAASLIIIFKEVFVSAIAVYGKWILIFL